jgi:hypothetical protein
LEQTEHAASAWFRFAQLLSFCAGIGFMYAVTFFEEDHHSPTSHSQDEYHHDHHHHGDVHGSMHIHENGINNEL